ncbi:MAG: cobyrinate a,c-diamide synthase [Dethiobacter sp.]|jgi:cobyrinic acid a,c-diamide synthase|nr:cobyrinate a,c-diamide synthase [Dethiobacter sp.]MBS3900520.1 cobyrinate a,c-diamide synthase [Dethiobacter sp.]MBS3989374.1 cobyrinate a,c-diamide synthase [Dethiobacter sp.]
MKRILIAGTHSGVGKTMLTAGLICALRRRGQHVIPFKVGPDYIDPGFHAAAAGVPAGNLDSWMMAPEQVLEILHRRVPADAIAVIEGAMGIYDGRKGQGEIGSSAHVAKITGTPVLLVASGAKMARSAAALIGGYLQFDPAVPFAGIVLNQLSGESHFQLLKEAVKSYLTLPVFGYLPKDSRVTVPERHLGLLPAAENDDLEKLFTLLADLVEETIDVNAVLASASAAGPLAEANHKIFPAQSERFSCRIAVARDEAFSFYYAENLELLSCFGAELVPFSPLHDERLPEECHGILLGGGFPEVFAAKLAQNEAILQSVKAAALAGMPIYAECGGYMYLAQELQNSLGEAWPMAGVFPGRAVMRKKRRALGYVEVSGLAENFLLPENETCRGHEFHWSEMEQISAPVLFRKLPQGEMGGERYANCQGSYFHLHFLSNPGIARRFVTACTNYAGQGGS